MFITFLKLRFVYFLFPVVMCADDFGSRNVAYHQCFLLINIFGSKTSLGLFLVTIRGIFIAFLARAFCLYLSQDVC